MMAEMHRHNWPWPLPPHQLSRGQAISSTTAAQTIYLPRGLYIDLSFLAPGAIGCTLLVANCTLHGACAGTWNSDSNVFGGVLA